MTRANLLALAERFGLYADQPDMRPDAIIGDMRTRIEFIGFTPDVTTVRPIRPARPSSASPSTRRPPELANKGANELVSLMLQENVRLRTGRAGDTLEFFEARGRAAVGRARAEVPGDRRLQDRQRLGAARQPDRPPRPAGARAGAAADARARGGGAAGTSAPPWSGSSSAPAAPRPPPRSAPRRRSCRRCRASSPSSARSTRPTARPSGCWRPASRRSRSWSTSSARRARCPVSEGAGGRSRCPSSTSSSRRSTSG